MRAGEHAVQCRSTYFGCTASLSEHLMLCCIFICYRRGKTEGDVLQVLRQLVLEIRDGSGSVPTHLKSFVMERCAGAVCLAGLQNSRLDVRYPYLSFLAEDTLVFHEVLAQQRHCFRMTPLTSADVDGTFRPAPPCQTLHSAGFRDISAHTNGLITAGTLQ